MLEKFTRELVHIFRGTTTKHEAHERSRQVFHDMARDATCLRAALAHEIRKPGALNTRHFPAVGLTITNTTRPKYGVVEEHARSGAPIDSPETIDRLLRDLRAEKQIKSRIDGGPAPP